MHRTIANMLKSFMKPILKEFAKKDLQVEKLISYRICKMMKRKEIKLDYVAANNYLENKKIKKAIKN
jgi:hypothetical protein